MKKRSFSEATIRIWAASPAKTFLAVVIHTLMGILIAYYLFGAPMQWSLIVGALLPTSLMALYAYHLKSRRASSEEIA